MVDSSSNAGFYLAGAEIPLTVVFSKAVTVEGTPILALNSGSTGRAGYQ